MAGVLAAAVRRGVIPVQGQLALLHAHGALDILRGPRPVEQLVDSVVGLGVGADSKLSHCADPNLSQGWTPSVGRSSVDKYRFSAVCRPPFLSP